MRWLAAAAFWAGVGVLAACPSRAAETSGAGAGTGSAKPAAARLISLTPSATEVVAALGATDALVGVDDYSTFPAEVGKLPKVGSFLAPNLEVIVRLKPSLVIVDDVHGQVAGALHDAGVATAACAMHDLGDVKAALRTVGDRIGKSAEATQVVAAIDGAIARAAAAKPPTRPRVLAVIDREAGGLGELVAAGPGSWVDELLAVVGADNALAAASVRYPKISIEEVLRARPAVILDLSYAARQGTEAWQALKLAPAPRLVAIQAPYLLAPSPRVAEALADLAKALN
ncbi:MAG TPA: helical backbone metal receptor [Kofleriaceae bacterium]|nr:helical backbone metal receptor [Kofleriaceae bacterium]